MNTTNEAIPPHVAVRTSEQSITGWRQHSLRHFGDGKGRWKWSLPTTEPLDKSGWLDEKMPTTYSVRTLIPCLKHQRGFDVECNHCSITSAPVLVDTKAAGDVGPVLTPEEFGRATYLWRNRQKAQGAKSVRDIAHQATSQGVLSISRQLLNKLTTAQRFFNEAKLRHNKIIEGQAFLSSAIDDAQNVVNKLKR